MVMTKTLNKKLTDWLKVQLEDNSFEDLLEKWDIDVADVFLLLFEGGMIDPELIEELL